MNSVGTVFLFFALQSSLTIDTLSCYEWVPQKLLTKPFIAFVNDLSDPSWITTSNKTLKQKIEDVVIPAKVNFGAICVGCIGQDFYSSISLTITGPNDDTYIVKKMGYNMIDFNVGENKCLTTMSIFYVGDTSQTLSCKFDVDWTTYNYTLLVTPESYSDGDTTHRLIREYYIEGNNQTILDCDKTDQKFSNAKINTTLWWYESRGEIMIPFHISKASEYPGGLPPSTVDTIGCVTYEMSEKHVFGTYEKKYRYDGVHNYTNILHQNDWLHTIPSSSQSLSSSSTIKTTTSSTTALSLALSPSTFVTDKVRVPTRSTPSLLSPTDTLATNENGVSKIMAIWTITFALGITQCIIFLEFLA